MEGIRSIKQFIEKYFPNNSKKLLKRLKEKDCKKQMYRWRDDCNGQ